MAAYYTNEDTHGTHVEAGFWNRSVYAGKLSLPQLLRSCRSIQTAVHEPEALPSKATVYTLCLVDDHDLYEYDGCRWIRIGVIDGI